MMEFIPGGQAYLRQLQPRDSILVADQLEYGFELDSVKTGTSIALPDFSQASNDTLTVVRTWKIDTLKNYRKAGMADIRASIVLAPFEAGTYELPAIPVARDFRGVSDTLLFESLNMEVKTMPVDTATYQPHDLKGQTVYPVTAREVVPWAALGWLLAAVVTAVSCLVIIRRRRETGAPARKDPAYIVALRELDRYRGDKFWAPEKQKTFYSGITDALKKYIDDRFGIDAPEMTTAELFAALKTEDDLTPELYGELKEMFERADFVKFAKYTAPDEDNAAALPLAVRFVTTTYQTELEEENEGKEAAGN